MCRQAESITLGIAELATVIKQGELDQNTLRHHSLKCVTNHIYGSSVLLILQAGFHSTLELLFPSEGLFIPTEGWRFLHSTGVKESFL